MDSLVPFANIVDGALQPAKATFESFDPSTGKPWPLIPRCGALASGSTIIASCRARQDTGR
jgi:hypothetical protein